MYVLDLQRRRSHRISSGLENFTSLAATIDGNKLVATVSRPHESLWRVPLGTHGADSATESAPVKLLADGALPRLAQEVLVYKASSGDTEAIWIKHGENAREIWRSSHAHILSAPAISDDDPAYSVFHGAERQDRAQRRGPGWLAVWRQVTEFPDFARQPGVVPGPGLSVLSAVMRDGEPRLMRIFLNGEPPRLFVAEYRSTDPVWSPDQPLRRSIRGQTLARLSRCAPPLLMAGPFRSPASY